MEPIEGSSGSAQQYNLKWTNHTNNILEMFSEQLLNGLLVDVTLFCEGQFIKAHKMVLSACSPYFQELFRVHTIDHPVIIMNGARFVAVKQMVDFMYQGEIKVSDADLDHLLTIAENLQIKGLCKIRRESSNDAEPSQADTPKQDNHEEPNTASSMLPKRRKRRKLSHSPGAAIDEPQTNGDCSSNPSMESYAEEPSTTPPVKITRPRNAFMIFSSEWRKKLAIKYQDENCKEISARLGLMWKSLSVDEKDEYFLAAKKAIEDHRLKYPEFYLAKAAKAALKGSRVSTVRRVTNVRRVKRKKSGASAESTGLSEESTVAPKESTEDIKEEDPDENNLVVAESQCSNSSADVV